MKVFLENGLMEIALASGESPFPFSNFMELPSKETKNEKYSPEFCFTFTVLNLPETIIHIAQELKNIQKYSM